jgi:hypothetical protein
MINLLKEGTKMKTEEIQAKQQSDLHKKL